MADDDSRLARVVARLQNLPSISLPTDYPRPSGSNKLVEAAHLAELSEQTCLSLLKLTLADEDEDETAVRPSGFHLLLAAFSVLLHRYTGDTDLVIGSSSAAARDPLVLRIPLNPTDPFVAVVRQVQQVEAQADADTVPFDTLVRALALEAPLFRVRFFDDTDAPDTDHTFLRSTSLTSDLTIFVTRPLPSLVSTRASLAPRIALRVLYNSLLFTPARIACLTDQLAALLLHVAAHPHAPIGSVPLDKRRTGLPDPKAELAWCEWPGAITDVFDRNAKAWPTRACVVQSLDVEGKEGPTREKRVYTYAAIRRAANVLAHHLLVAGVQREEVVMVYAHRSVELVVAVMAVLKVGATFSVIGGWPFLPLPTSFCPPFRSSQHIVVCS